MFKSYICSIFHKFYWDDIRGLLVAPYFSAVAIEIYLSFLDGSIAWFLRYKSSGFGLYR